MFYYRYTLIFMLLLILKNSTEAGESNFSFHHASYKRLKINLSPEKLDVNSHVSITSSAGTFTTNIAQNDCSIAAPIKIVVIGSSTAEGYRVKPEESWVGRYEQYLKNINPAHEVVNLAKGGYTTCHLMPTGYSKAGRPAPDPERNISKAISLRPDGIIINLPSNDAASSYSTAEQMANFAAMYQQAQEHNIPVWITTTQPRDNLNTSQNGIQISVRDSVLTTYGLYALDFWTAITRYVDGQPKIRTEHAYGDGVHLNPEGHRVLFEAVKTQLVYERIANLFTSVKSGDYADKATWNLHTVPGSEAKVTIKAGHTLTLSSNISPQFLKTEANSTLDLKNYQLTVNCAWDMQGTLYADQAGIEFTGAEDMILAGMTSVKTLKINKPAGTLRLGNDLTVSGTLALNQGAVALEGYDLIVENPLSLAGGSASSYVQTTGQGDLVYKVEETIINMPLVFPVGDAAHYTPFTFILKTGSITHGKLSMTVVDSEPVEAGTADPLLSRYWDLRQEGLHDYLYSVKYQYLDADVTGSSGEAEKELKVIKYSQAHGWQIGGQVDEHTNTLFADGINSFSIFSGGNHIEGASPLPVTLVAFEVYAAEEGAAVLDWQTAFEQNNDYFAIERSADAVHWSAIAQIKGSGHSYEPVAYSFTDKSPLDGYSYYRLKQVDFDGKFAYSSVVSFFSEQPLAVHLALVPNPAYTGQALSLSLLTSVPETAVILEIRDIAGKLHYTQALHLQHTHTEHAVQHSLHPGLYLITLRQGHRIVQEKLLVH